MEANREQQWVVRASRESHDCINPVRSCEELYYDDVLELSKRNGKELLKLSIGDPTRFGTLPPHPIVRESVRKALDSGKYEGYGNSAGLPETRTAVAEAFTCEEAPLTADDVVMASACSGAIEMSLTVLANPGQNVIMPSPGFGVYQCHAEARGVEMRFYKLVPERGWEIDLEDLERQIDDKTATFIVNNPSNPCGSVFSRQHLQDIVALAERHRLPILADEIYFGMVFRGHEFHSVASLSKNVPVLTCGGPGKVMMIPGWRLGWILIHDRNDAFKQEVIPGLYRLAMKLLGPCTLVQAAVPDMLKIPASYHEANLAKFEENAKLCLKGLENAPGLRPIMPAGAMYMMVLIELEHFPGFETDLEFTRQLVAEQSVFCLPGKAFCATGCMRIVLIMPDEKISDACGRITEFCNEHYSHQKSNV